MCVKCEQNVEWLSENGLATIAMAQMNEQQKKGLGRNKIEIERWETERKAKNWKGN